MSHYNKGANAERELIALLLQANVAALRAAGSGVAPSAGPDVVALTPGRVLAIECKAWKASTLSISHVQVKDLQGWCARSGAELVVAWKIPHKGWRFLGLEHFSKTPKFYSVSRDTALRKGLELNRLLGLQTPLLFQ
ncbi:MAG: hypothetical protein HY393_03885 [Candidatus Diapherotrites archaeon]|nr:hypothetical protein [Candidatus Diapherotrites archaeon]